MEEYIEIKTNNTSGYFLLNLFYIILFNELYNLII